MIDVAQISDIITEDERNAASQALARALNNHPITVDTTSGFLENATVNITKGNSFNPNNADDNHDMLRIAITHPLVASSKGAKAIAEIAEKLFAETPALKHEAIFESQKDYLSGLKDTLTGFIAAAKDTPAERYLRENLAEWKGFDSSFAGPGLPDYAVSYAEQDRSFYSFMPVPTNSKDPEAAKEAAEKVAENMRTRLPEIKASLAKRAERYLGELSAEDKAKFDALELEVSTQPQDKWTTVVVKISSPEQKEWQAKPGETVPDPEELKKTNPLSLLVGKKNDKGDDLLGKALGHSFLIAGENARDVFPMVAGREDIARCMKKGLAKLAEAKPELAAEIEEFRKEPIFQPQQQWNKAPEDRGVPTKFPAHFKVDPKTPDTLEIKLSLPLDKAKSVVCDLSKMAATNLPQEAPCPTEPTPAIVTPQHCDIAQQHSQAEEAANKMGQMVEAARAAAAQVGVNVPRTWKERKEQERLSQQNSTGLSA